MNKVILVGNLTRDVELKQTQSGKAYARAGIAVKRPFSKDAVDFFNLLAWEQKAEFLSKYFAKGSKAVIEGRLQTSTYENKDGNKVNSVEVVIEQIEFAGGGRKDDSKRNGSNDAPPPDDVDMPF